MPSLVNFDEIVLKFHKFDCTEVLKNKKSQECNNYYLLDLKMLTTVNWCCIDVD